MGDSKRILWTEVQASATLVPSSDASLLRNRANRCGESLRIFLQNTYSTIPIIVYVEHDAIEFGYPHVDFFINFKGNISRGNLKEALEGIVRRIRGVRTLELVG
mmetsp:Transcript_21458/g.52570  ORF Transcript_21458/g.52570 Transcript_21458/m.52570 type:complete len:104 (-) Transcript_21458:175-486(-)